MLSRIANGLKIRKDYLGKAQCDAIKGIFIFLVFFGHFQSYVQLAGGHSISTHLGQMVVALFLFYSGYGLMAQLSNRGRGYLESIPRKRILTTLINFDIAVIIFIFVNMLLGKPVGLTQTALSLCCWESVGNSNWYIFAIVVCYAIFWMSFSISKGCPFVMLCLCVTATIFGLSFVRPFWWYNTMLCFAAGCAYARCKALIELFFEADKGCWRWYLVEISLLLFIVALRHYGAQMFGLVFNVRAIAFALLVVILTMRIRIKSRVLEWAGQNLFPLYIYQRIPMLIAYHCDPNGFGAGRSWLYFVLCLVMTCGIAMLYPRWQVKLG